MMVTGWDYFFLKRKPNRQFRCKEIHRKHNTRVNGPKDIMGIMGIFVYFLFREGAKKNVFLGLCPKVWVGGGPKSQTL